MGKTFNLPYTTGAILGEVLNEQTRDRLLQDRTYMETLESAGADVNFRHFLYVLISQCETRLLSYCAMAEIEAQQLHEIRIQLISLMSGMQWLAKTLQLTAEGKHPLQKEEEEDGQESLKLDPEGFLGE